MKQEVHGFGGPSLGGALLRPLDGNENMVDRVLERRKTGAEKSTTHVNQQNNNHDGRVTALHIQ